VSVLGSSGSGKSTFARELARRLGVVCVELDALHHLPGWQEAPVEEFRRAVAAAIDAPGWVVDGSYSKKLGDMVLGRADTVVWLDYPRWFVLQRVVRRTLRRVVTREELWNGNREAWTNLYSRDPHQNIVVWSWTHFHENRRVNEARMDDRWMRFRSPRAAKRWLSRLAAPA
jgi:adenylate kinase family enzyme